MKEIVEILTMFIFSSIFDGLIILTYFILDNNIKKHVKKFIIALFGISLINAVLYTFLSDFGLLFQIVFISYTAFLLGFVFKISIKRSILSVFKSMMYLLVLDVLFSILITFLTKMSLFGITFGKDLLISFIPFKIAEFFIIYYIKKNLIGKR